MPNQFAFISISDPGRPSDVDRQIIRSHVMRGKNKRVGSRRSLREAAQQCGRSAGLQNSVRYELPTQSDSSTVNRTDATEDDFSSGSSGEDVVGACLKLERQVRTRTGVFSAMDDEFEREVGCTALVAEFLKFNSFKGSSFPLKEKIEFEVAENVYIPWVFSDLAYAHSIFLATSALSDFSQGRPFTRTTLYHLKSTITHLNRNLATDDGYASDSTTYTIITLAMLSTLFGDLVAVRAHMAGLQRIVGLRGGEQSLAKRPKQSFMMNSLDLASSVDSGCFPYYSVEPDDWRSAFSGPPLASDMTSLFLCVVGLVDARLATVFHDLQRLTRLANTHVQRDSRLKGDLFQHLLGSIQRRLLWLRYPPDQGWSERLRLGMLAFLTTSFRLPGKMVSFKYLASNYRTSCQTLVAASAEVETLASWLILIGAMSVFEPNERWLRAKWLSFAVPGDDWEVVRRRVASVAWIDSVHDEPGMLAYEALPH
ncbi:hypothetical protein LTR56_011865 [Elasticomyces elasticus]|nr:hypothetical protein LTR56_011865 [Elasticomyces elasticus]KAK3666406.1 hypothetical protein LTR22_002711 [Elasticomyces elasticus]KAK4931226.1 hypothetical protein LTR49_002284 [Elasticomyces elasticus]KAK5767843.1 hypothetical protein LTS12_001995 [Elasticomyces elasticus]